MTGARPQVGISTGCYHGFDVATEDAVTNIAELGVDTIELFVQAPPELEPEVSRVIVERVRRSRLEVVSVHPYVFGWENLLFASYDRQRRWAWDHVRAHLALCRATGADAYVSHGPPAHHVLAPDGTLLPHYVQTAGDLVALAADHGVHYCLENVSYGLVRTPDDVRRHRDAVPDLQFVVDFKSAWKVGHAPAEFLAEDLLPAVHHTQVSFRCAGRYGLPAPPGDVLEDAELADGLSARTIHVLEVEARDAAEVARSVAAMRS